jgi:citrate lyase subunit beta/citryl-CoA lyase
VTFTPPGPAILFCPGDRPERFDKAAAAADVAILDLEDAVAPDAKAAALGEVLSACRRIERGLIVRINSVGSPWHDDEVAALRPLDRRPTLMLPKTAGPEALRGLDGFDVIALLESAAGVLNAAPIAREPNCAALFWGAEDLVADLGGRNNRSPAGPYYRVIEQARATTLFAAAAAGKWAIDAIYVDIPDLDGLAAESAEAADLGFRAKACIHPSQAAVVRDAFAPTERQRQWATAVLAEAARSASAVFAFEGRMIDAPLLAQAHAIVGAAATPRRATAD